MNTQQQALFDATIALGKTTSYAYRVADGQHVLGGRTGPPKLYPDLDVAAVWTRWRVNGEKLSSIAADVEVPKRTLQRRLRDYRMSPAVD